jgi:hypothetical protein
MTLREVRTDPEILQHAVNDGINIFVREVLIPEGIVDQRRYDGLSDERKHAICRAVAASWKVCQIDDEA